MIVKLLSEAFNKLDLASYEILYLYSDLREIGKLKASGVSKKEFLDQILDYLLTLTSTIIVPTFSYTTTGIFNPKSTATNLGALNSHTVYRNDVVRSDHPLFSHACIGKYSNLLKNIGKSAFGNESVYARLNNLDQVRTAFLYIGRPVEAGNTMPHYLEQANCVPYRFEKKFPTKVFKDNLSYQTGYSAFVRKQDNPINDYAFSFALAFESLYMAGAIKEILLKGNFTNISLIELQEFVQILNMGLANNPNYFLKTPYKIT